MILNSHRVINVNIEESGYYSDVQEKMLGVFTFSTTNRFLATNIPIKSFEDKTISIGEYPDGPLGFQMVEDQISGNEILEIYKGQNFMIGFDSEGNVVESKTESSNYNRVEFHTLDPGDVFGLRINSEPWWRNGSMYDKPVIEITVLSGALALTYTNDTNNFPQVGNMLLVTGLSKDIQNQGAIENINEEITDLQEADEDLSRRIERINGDVINRFVSR